MQNKKMVMFIYSKEGHKNQKISQIFLNLLYLSTNFLAWAATGEWKIKLVRQNNYLDTSALRNIK